MAETHIASGGQGTVSILQADGIALARKHIPPQLARAAYMERAVAGAMAPLPEHHAHIVQLLQASVNQDSSTDLYFELGLMDLHDFLSTVPGNSCGDYAFCREWMLQLAYALNYCHTELGVAHRDVKPENILLFAHAAGDGANGSAQVLATTQQYATGRAALLKAAAAPSDALHGYLVKLADFGSALVGAPGHPLPEGLTPHGSTIYAAPEVTFIAHQRRLRLAQTPPGALQFPDSARGGRGGPSGGEASPGYAADRVDTWSFGVALYLMAGGHLPFDCAATTCPKFCAFVAATQPEAAHASPPLPWLTQSAQAAVPVGAAWRWPSSFCPALVHLLSRCLRVCPRERWTMGQVVEHPWFSDPGWNPSLSKVMGAVNITSPLAALPSSQPPWLLGGGGSGSDTLLAPTAAAASAEGSALSSHSSALSGGMALGPLGSSRGSMQAPLPRRQSHASDKMSAAGSTHSMASLMRAGSARLPSPTGHPPMPGGGRGGALPRGQGPAGRFAIEVEDVEEE